MSYLKFLPVLIFAKLLAEPMGSTSSELATTEGEPSSYIEGMVSAISGDLYLPVTDLSVRGVQPIHINRIYTSHYRDKEGRWIIFDYTKAISLQEDRILILNERNGSRIAYQSIGEGNEQREYELYKRAEGAGITNCGRGRISGQNFYQNNKITLSYFNTPTLFTLHTSDGSKRIYKNTSQMQYRLIKEIHTNGNKTHYEYHTRDDYYPKKIYTTNFNENIVYAWVTIKRTSNEFIFTTSDKRTLRYIFERKKNSKESRKKILTKVIGSENPDEILTYEYEKSSINLNLVQRKFPNNNLIQYRYYKKEDNNRLLGDGKSIKSSKDKVYGRIKRIWSHIGPKNILSPTHSIDFLPPFRKKRNIGETTVYDALNGIKKYYWSDKNELLRIEHGVGEESTVVQEILSWTTEYHENVPFLQAKSICDENRNPIITHQYYYDLHGNIRHEKVYGDFSGENQHPLVLAEGEVPEKGTQCECYTIDREYTPDGRNLLCREEENNTRKIWNYQKDSNLLKNFYLEEKNCRIWLRQFYIYNKDNVLIKQIEDDGPLKKESFLPNMTEKHIKNIIPYTKGKFTNFPHIVDELYYDFKISEEKLLSRAIYTYKDNLLVDTISYYDANENHIYTKNHEYDKKDRLIETNDALGRLHTISYDENNRISTEKKPNEAFETHYTYNAAGKVIKTEQKVDGKTLRTQSYTYDRKNRPSTYTDHRGNTTITRYDNLDNPTRTIYSDKSFSTKKYNALGEVVEETDPQKNTTYKKTNSRGQVTHIRHPDGAEERFIYNLNGTLKTAITPIGTKIHTTYDYQKRPLTVRTEDTSGNTLSEEIYTYNAFHLLSKKDPDGVLTEYTYDPAGRLLSETTHESPTKSITLSYAYDARGRVITKTHTSTYGPTRVYQTRFDDTDRIIEEREEDDQGTIFSLTTYGYDDFDNKISITRDKSVTTHKYDPFKRLIQTIDPLENVTTIDYHDAKESTITTTDSLGRRTVHTKDAFDSLIKLEKYSSNNELLLTETYLYDKNRNLIQQTSHLPNKIDPITKSWAYDTRNRVIQITHPDATTTCYTYTPDGHQETLTKPSGVVLTSTYDALGRETSLISSDNTVYYTFTHDVLGRIKTATDQLTQKTTLRDYDHYGNLLRETLANGLILRSTYDSHGRKLTLTYPDGTLTTYTYDAYHLLSVQRNNNIHTYDQYDLNHNLLRETLANGESITYTPDPNNKLIGLHSSFQSQTLLLDPVNNVRSSTITFPQAITNTYTYDDLDQLTSESGLFNNTYEHDAHHNRLSKNDLPYRHSTNNELEVSPESTFSYLHGNRLSKDDTRYTYDALDRLISIQTPLKTYVFTYDAFHRRLTRTYDNESHSYLYDDQNDIGAYGQSGLLQLRILGQGYGAEIGATVLIESQSRYEIPRHDLFGNIIALQNLTTGKISQTQHYNPFGQTFYPTTNDTWGFQSKRHEHDLIYFGRRYYDPISATWLTPDPKGYEEGPNLYQYLLNNPLLSQDLYGLSKDRGPKGLYEGTCYVRSSTARKLLHKPCSSPLFNALDAMKDVRDGVRRPTGIPHTKFYGNLAGDSPTKILIYMVNGINTSLNEALDRGEEVFEYFGGQVDVKVLWNSTHGLPLDLFDVLIGKIGIPINASRQFEKDLRKELPIREKVFIFAHSEGTLVTKNGTKKLEEKERMKIDFRGFGGAHICKDEDFGKVVNYVSEMDIVSYSARNPWYLGSFFFLKEADPNITYLKPETYNPFGEHSFENPTYHNQFVDILEDIKKEQKL